MNSSGIHWPRSGLARLRSASACPTLTACQAPRLVRGLSSPHSRAGWLQDGAGGVTDAPAGGKALRGCKAACTPPLRFGMPNPDSLSVSSVRPDLGWPAFASGLATGWGREGMARRTSGAVLRVCITRYLCKRSVFTLPPPPASVRLAHHEGCLCKRSVFALPPAGVPGVPESFFAWQQATPRKGVFCEG